MNTFKPFLQLSALTGHLPEDLALAWRAWLRLYDQGLERIPFYLALDISRIFILGDASPFRGREEKSGRTEELRRIRQRYSIEFLGRLLLTSWAEPLRDLLQSLHEPQAAVVRAVELSGRRLARYLAEIPPLDAVEVRKISPEHLHESEPEARGNEEGSAVELKRLEAFLDAIGPTDTIHRLIQKRDIFALRHAIVLGNDYLRRAATEIMEVSEAVLQGGRRIRISSPTSGQILEEEKGKLRPLGGIRGLARKGLPEALLPSEIAYHDPRLQIDPLDVRIQEGEALFLAKDETLCLRPIHYLDILIPHHFPLTFQVPPHRWRISNLIHGLAVGIIRASRQSLPGATLRSRIFIDSGKDTDAQLTDEVQKDEELLKTVLTSEIVSGECEIFIVTRLPVVKVLEHKYGKNEVCRHCACSKVAIDHFGWECRKEIEEKATPFLPGGVRLLILMPAWMLDRPEYLEPEYVQNYQSKKLLLVEAGESKRKRSTRSAVDIRSALEIDRVIRIAITGDTESIIEAGWKVISTIWAEQEVVREKQK